jgi:hypothetical protein
VSINNHSSEKPTSASAIFQLSKPLARQNLRPNTTAVQNQGLPEDIYSDTTPKPNTQTQRTQQSRNVYIGSKGSQESRKSNEMKIVGIQPMVK